MDATVAEIGAEVTVVGTLPVGALVAFDDHGVGVVSTSVPDGAGGRSTVIPARGAAPREGDAVGVVTVLERPRGARLRADGGATVGVLAAAALSVDAWQRFDRVSLRVTGAWVGDNGAAELLVGWDPGAWAVGAQAGVAHWDRLTADPGGGLWGRVGTQDGLHVGAEGSVLAQGGVSSRVWAQVPAGNLVDLLASASIPIHGDKPAQRKGVGVGVWVRRWGGPGAIRGELWARDLLDEVDRDSGLDHWRPELRVGVRW
jgi:hypothetical protein